MALKIVYTYSGQFHVQVDATGMAFSYDLANLKSYIVDLVPPEYKRETAQLLMKTITRIHCSHKFDVRSRKGHINKLLIPLNEKLDEIFKTKETKETKLSTKNKVNIKVTKLKSGAIRIKAGNDLIESKSLQLLYNFWGKADVGATLYGHLRKLNTLSEEAQSHQDNIDDYTDRLKSTNAQIKELKKELLTTDWSE